jgi:hypothetical protein
MMTAKSKNAMLGVVIKRSSVRELEDIIRRVEAELKKRKASAKRFIS